MAGSCGGASGGYTTGMKTAISLSFRLRCTAWCSTATRPNDRPAAVAQFADPVTGRQTVSRVQSDRRRGRPPNRESELSPPLGAQSASLPREILATYRRHPARAPAHSRHPARLAVAGRGRASLVGAVRAIHDSESTLRKSGTLSRSAISHNSACRTGSTNSGSASA